MTGPAQDRGWLARVIVRATSWLVPRQRRREWREEWEAELGARAHEDDRGLARRALGAPLDALVLQREQFSLTGVLREVRWAIRSLRRTPTFTFTTVITLALGIGAVAALYSVVNGVLRRPLPFPASDRLVRVDTRTGDGGIIPISRPDWRDWNDLQKSFTGIASYLPLTAETVLGGNDAARLRVQRVSANFFDVLGVAAVRGRTFSSAESGRQPPPVAVLSWGAWQRLFGGRADLNAISLDLLGAPHAVIGVMPPGFEFLGPTDIWVLHEREPIWEVRSWPAFGAFGRLRDGVTAAAAEAELSAIAKRISGRSEQTSFASGAHVVLLRDWAVAGVRETLLTLFAAAGFVLLVACANVASALLARGTARARELAVRLSLGASRARAAGVLLTESMVLAVLGAAGGLLLARGGLYLVRAFGANLVPRLSEVKLNGAVVLFVVLAGMVSVMLFGLSPALLTTRKALATTLRVVGRGRGRSWSVLVASEIAAAMALLVGVGLLVRSVVAIRGASLGWDPRDLLAVQVALPPSRYADGDARIRYVNALTTALRQVPGVTALGATTQLPLDRYADTAPAYQPDVGYQANNVSMAGLRIVNAAYFSAMGIPLLGGRNFRPSDRMGSPDVALISESLARRLWPDESPLGKHLRHNNDFGVQDERTWLTVVGVVGNVRHWASAMNSQHEVYVPYTQRGLRASDMTFVLRYHGNLSAVAAGVRARSRGLDPEVPVSLRTIDERLVATYVTQRFSLILLSVFGGVAALLAVIGSAGVVAYAVERRRREIGIRVALGAHPWKEFGRLQRATLRPALAGVVIGSGLALVVTRAVSSMLYGVTAQDPLTYLAAAALLLAAAWAGSGVPARRALRVRPAEVLRTD